jgi:hypothetical protein
MDNVGKAIATVFGMLIGLFIGILVLLVVTIWLTATAPDEKTTDNAPRPATTNALRAVDVTGL